MQVLLCSAETWAFMQKCISPLAIVPNELLVTHMAIPGLNMRSILMH